MPSPNPDKNPWRFLRRIASRPAHAAVWICAVTVLLLTVAGYLVRNQTVLRQDVVQYYSYVPATFLHGDLTMRYAHGDGFYSDKVWGWKTPSGAFLQKYTMGLGILYTPTFLVGHAWALLSGLPADGYSAPYQLAIQIGTVLYLTVGLWFLCNLLLSHFAQRTVAVVLLTTVFGTNLLYYAAVEGPMPHAYIFCLLSAFLFFTQTFHDRASWTSSFWLGLIGGLIVLIRPNHILIWLLPLLYGLDRRKIAWWREHLAKASLWPGVTSVIVLPQLLYWHHVTGRWVVYSYGDEGFFLLEPAIWSAWFSFRKGWLLYTPVMAFGVFGLFVLGNGLRSWRLPFLAFFATTTWVLTSWWCWWFGGSFGLRAFIDTYPVLAFGLAAVLQWSEKQRWKHRLLLTGWAMLIVLNLFQTLQYVRGVIHWDSMSREVYFATFGSLAIPEGYQEMLEPPNYQAALRGER